MSTKPVKTTTRKTPSKKFSDVQLRTTGPELARAFKAWADDVEQNPDRYESRGDSRSYGTVCARHLVNLVLELRAKKTRKKKTQK